MTKNQILEEIKRTAAQQGGKPPGMKRFLTETGIKECDWRGKYWMRWSDALQEAGFSPNQWQDKLNADKLILALVDSTRELGYFPVEAYLQMKARAEPGFPSTNALRRNLGDKLERISKVRAFCKARNGYEDVVSICDRELSAATTAPTTSEAANTADDDETDFGFVYLMKSGRHYKIGRSNAVGRRHYELSVQMPESVTEVHRVSTDDPAGIEAYWHRRFRDKRKNGEWFDLDAQDVKAFRRRKFM